MPKLDVVTGAFAFTGSYIAERLLSAGRSVRTLTRRRPHGHPLAGIVDMRPYDFDRPAALRQHLAGADTLYITYWMRFPHHACTFQHAVQRIRLLLAAARDAGVRRVVYISVSNASPSAPTAYFRAKAEAEAAVRGAGMSYGIVRPTLLFGEGDILINNLAWALRRFPLFGVAGAGEYRVQPVYVGDVAELAVRLGREEETSITDAAGPEVMAFVDLVRLVAHAVHGRALIVHVPPALALAAAHLIGLRLRDVMLTRDEVAELMGGLLVSKEEPTGRTRFSGWLERRAGSLGRRYVSELGRNYRLDARLAR